MVCRAVCVQDAWLGTGRWCLQRQCKCSLLCLPCGPGQRPACASGLPSVHLAMRPCYWSLPSLCVFLPVVTCGEYLPAEFDLGPTEAWDTGTCSPTGSHCLESVFLGQSPLMSRDGTAWKNHKQSCGPSLALQPAVLGAPCPWRALPWSGRDVQTAVRPGSGLLLLPAG